MNNILKTTFVWGILCLSTSISIFAQKQVEPSLYQKVDKGLMTQWVDSVFGKMTIDQKIGQTIMVITTSDNTKAKEQELLGYVNNQHIGGIIFLKGTPTSQARMTNSCQSASKIPLMIAIDGEWGLSMRLENTTRFPQNMMLGAIQDDSLVYRYGLEVARQCREMGIHVNFAPAVDVNSNPNNPVIGRRSFGEDPVRVAKLGILYSQGLEDGRVLSVAKHFPGHGDTSTDSHKVLPLISHNKARLDSVELYPFREYINAGLGGMLTAHLNVPNLDNSGDPSSLSKPIVTDLLQKEMGFSGLIFTDGLAMKGVSTEPNMSVRILEAGNDILLGPISPAKEFKAIKTALEQGKISQELIEERCRKILTYKYLLGVDQEQVIELDSLEVRLNTPYAEWLTRKMNQKGITLLKNDSELIPLKGLDKKKIAAVSIGEKLNNSFHQTLKQYGNVKCFSVADASGLSSLKASLSKFNTVIVSIHSTKTYNVDAIKNILGDKGVFVLFSTPYKLSSYASVVKKSDAVIVAYENTDLAQEYAAQAIFGGNDVDGKLPVSVKGLFERGEGIKIEKTRLSYGLPEDVNMSSEALSNIENIVKEGIEEEAYPGCQVLIAKDGVVIYNRSFGSFEYNKRRPVGNEDLYDIASMTKAVATIPAVMKLYDEKKLKLQTPLSEYVLAMRGSDKATSTVKDALYHESGLVSFIPYYMPAIDENSYEGRLFSNKRTSLYNVEFDETTWARQDYKYKPELISKTPKGGYELKIANNLYGKQAYKDTIVGNIINSKLRSNKNYMYSCLNFMLLKEAIESVSKTDLNSYVQTNFYEKLGASSTTYNPLNRFEKDDIAPTEKDDFLRKQLLQGYVHDEGAAFMGGVSGNAGLFSNANDIAKICQMWLNSGNYGGDTLLSKNTCQLFTTSKSSKSRRGLGFDKPDIRNNRLSPCSPQTPISTYGHTGFTGTCFWVDPDNNLIYVFLSNRVYPKRTHKKLMTLNIRSRIQEEIYNALKQ